MVNEKNVRKIIEDMKCGIEDYIKKVRIYSPNKAAELSMEFLESRERLSIEHLKKYPAEDVIEACTRYFKEEHGVSLDLSDFLPTEH